MFRGRFAEIFGTLCVEAFLKNPKHEIRNSKQSQMLKFQMFQRKEFREFEFWKFEFVSEFDIRISDFATPKAPLVWAMQVGR